MGCGSAAQSTSGYTSYESYAVQKGETVRSIARDHGISESVIYNLNPDSRNGIKANSILILPSTKSSSSKDKSVIIHKVQKQETLYGLAKKYGVSEESIKKHNEELYNRDLRIGETIYIPSKTTEGIKSPALELPPGIEEYEIVAKDTKYSISKKFGISVEELEALNPKMGETLEIGYKILVPSEKPKRGEELDTENFEYYEVQPKEGFYRLEKKFGLTEKEIVKLNPQAKDGLQDGMILKLPKPGMDKAEKDVSVENLESAVRYKQMKNVALMLPFGLTQSDLDSTKQHQDLLKNDATLRIALDFYSGALMAAEFAKEKGISVTLSVYDTKKNENTVASIISDRNFEKTDAVIGPLLQKNIEKAASMLERNKVPVFSPLSNREISNLSNIFQTLPASATLENKIIGYIKQHSINKNVILIVDSKHQQQRQKITQEIPSVRTISVSGNYAERKDVEESLSKDLENWVLLVSDRPILVSSSVNVLSDLANSHSIRLFSLEKNDAFDWEEVSNSRLAKLNYTFPSVNRSYPDANDPFIKKYKAKYGVVPNRYAIRGFDITYDVLLRMASEKDVYDAFNEQIETIYTENKFRYIQNKRDGYVNQAVYILKYTKDLNFEEVQ